MDNDFLQYFRDHQKRHEEREAEVMRLKADEPKMVKVGDKVLAAVGLIGYGYNWVRQECEIVAVADSAVKIRFEQYKHVEEVWIDRAFITDIIQE